MIRKRALLQITIAAAIGMAAGDGVAQIPTPGREPDWVKERGDEARKKFEEHGRKLQEQAGKGLPKPAAGAAAPPSVEYNPRARRAQSKPPAPAKQAESKAPMAAAAPARPPCVYKPVMSDDEINACR